MGECKTDNSCDTNKNSCDSGVKKSEGECNVAEDLLCLANQAWMELMKEKIKKSFEAKLGKKMDKTADVVADASIACWESKMAGKQACNDYKEKLFATFKS